MPILNQPTGSDLMRLFTLPSGSRLPVAGGITADIVDNDNSNNGTQSISYQAWQHVKTILTDANKDPGNLSQSDWEQADTALRWICVWEYSRSLRISAPQEGKDCEPLEEFKRRQKSYADRACDALSEMGLTSTKYCLTVFDLIDTSSVLNCSK